MTSVRRAENGALRRLRLRGFCSVAAVAGILAACSGDRREPSELPATHPLSVVRPNVPSTGTTAAGVPAPPLGLDAFEPWLALPELKAAADALEAGDSARAAREVQSVAERRPLQSTEVQSYQMLLARLRESAGDLGGATASYELAAAATGPLTGYAALGASRTLLAQGRAADAASWAARVPPGELVAMDAELVAADAAVKSGDMASAIAAWQRRLSKSDAGPEASLLSLRLAEALVDAGASRAASDQELSDALGRVRKVLSRTADLATMVRAEAAQAKLLAALSPELRAQRSRPSPDEDLERLKTLVDGKQYELAVTVSDGLLARLGEASRWDTTGCEATLLRARALAGQKEWTTAEEALVAAARRCKDPDVRARALFSAAKYATSTKRYVEAAGYYERLETDFPAHRLADDARLHRALCYREIGADARFTELLSRMPDDYPDGDMVLDGLFELALSRIAKADWASAESVLERAASAAAPVDAKRGLERAGRERYFLARARAARGDAERSLSDYEGIVRELPLSYYMLQAYTRLSVADAARARRALDAGLAQAQDAPFSFSHRPEFDLPGFVRALELLRIGDVPDATRELD